MAFAIRLRQMQGDDHLKKEETEPEKIYRENTLGIIQTQITYWIK